ncbi:MAG: hypothetical protein CMO34_03770 [Verrucomicrobia bacterium]|nr:hypothetical protein [Verrucomicrobiota bacterium]
MEKACANCGEELFGRVDKKFCSDQCRNTYNNKLHGKDNNFVRNTNRILRKNRKILESLTTKEKPRANKDKMMVMGFNFNYYTNQYITKDGRTYYYCYEYGYLPLENDWYAIVKKKEGMD